MHINSIKSVIKFTALFSVIKSTPLTGERPTSQIPTGAWPTKEALESIQASIRSVRDLNWFLLERQLSKGQKQEVQVAHAMIQGAVRDWNQALNADVAEKGSGLEEEHAMTQVLILIRVTRKIWCRGQLSEEQARQVQQSQAVISRASLDLFAIWLIAEGIVAAPVISDDAASAMASTIVDPFSTPGTENSNEYVFIAPTVIDRTTTSSRRGGVKCAD